VRVVEHETCDGWEHLLEKLEEVKAQGGEGCVARPPLALRRVEPRSGCAACNDGPASDADSPTPRAQAHAPPARVRVRAQAFVVAPQGQDVPRRRGARRRSRAGQGASSLAAFAASTAKSLWARADKEDELCAGQVRRHARRARVRHGGRRDEVQRWLGPDGREARQPAAGASRSLSLLSLSPSPSSHRHVSSTSISSSTSTCLGLNLDHALTLPPSLRPSPLPDPPPPRTPRRSAPSSRTASRSSPRRASRASRRSSASASTSRAPRTRSSRASPSEEEDEGGSLSVQLSLQYPLVFVTIVRTLVPLPLQPRSTLEPETVRPSERERGDRALSTMRVWLHFDHGLIVSVTLCASAASVTLPRPGRARAWVAAARATRRGRREKGASARASWCGREGAR